MDTNDPNHSVTAELTCTILLQQWQTVLVARGRWTWDKCRPAEVVLQTKPVDMDESDEVTWLFGLDLLLAAIDQVGVKIGAGDVKLVMTGNVCAVNLSSHEGTATLVFKSAKVREFAATVVSCRPDDATESATYLQNFDAELSELLG